VLAPRRRNRPRRAGSGGLNRTQRLRGSSANFQATVMRFSPADPLKKLRVASRISKEKKRNVKSETGRSPLTKIYQRPVLLDLTSDIGFKPRWRGVGGSDDIKEGPWGPEPRGFGTNPPSGPVLAQTLRKSPMMCVSTNVNLEASPPVCSLAATFARIAPCPS